MTIVIFSEKYNAVCEENERRFDMDLIKSIVGMFDVSNLKIKRKKKEKKPSVIKDLIDCPDQYKLEAFVENDEIIIKIRKVEKES